MGALIGGAVLAVTDDYESVFHVLGLLMGLGAAGLFLTVRSGGEAPVAQEG
jgi:hypothetical protein